VEAPGRMGWVHSIRPTRQVDFTAKVETLPVFHVYGRCDLLSASGLRGHLMWNMRQILIFAIASWTVQVRIGIHLLARLFSPLAFYFFSPVC